MNTTTTEQPHSTPATAAAQKPKAARQGRPAAQKAHGATSQARSAPPRPPPRGNPPRAAPRPDTPAPAARLPRSSTCCGAPAAPPSRNSRKPPAGCPTPCAASSPAPCARKWGWPSPPPRTQAPSAATPSRAEPPSCLAGAARISPGGLFSLSGLALADSAVTELLEHLDLFPPVQTLGEPPHHALRYGTGRRGTRRQPQNPLLEGRR